MKTTAYMKYLKKPQQMKELQEVLDQIDSKITLNQSSGKIASHTQASWFGIQPQLRSPQLLQKPKQEPKLENM